MNGTASPGPTATSPASLHADAADPNSGDDSSLDDLSSLASGDEEALLGELGPLSSITAVTRREPIFDDDDGGGDGANNDQKQQAKTPNGLRDHAGNNNLNGNGNGDDERPAKRQRTRAATPPPHPSPGGRKPKTISPPWKTIGADGPSSFNEGGRRKSGRINAVPIELQSGDKRITRRAINGQTSPPSATAINGHADISSPSPSISVRRPSTTLRAQPPQRSSSRQQPPRRSAAAAAAATTTEPRVSTSSSIRAHRRSSTTSSPPKKHPQGAAAATAGTRSQPSRSSRNARPARDAASAARQEAPTRTTPRIRLRTRTLTIPVVHPDQIKLRPKLAPSLPEYFAMAETVPVEEGGLLAPEDEPRMTDEMAAREAAVLMRIEKETEEGGLLTAPRCAAFQPEAAEEPPRQWAHNDHMVKAVANFRRLLGMEQQRHRASAKRLAEACRDEWIRRQPKSAEQLEAEARDLWVSRYRAVVRAMAGTWENVRQEINRRRLREWEAEEQRRVKAALQEAVARSEQKLQARRAQQDSEAPSDDDMDDDELDYLDDEEAGLESVLETGDVTADDGDADADDDESNMSSSEDEDDEPTKEEEDANANEPDEALTQDQLRQKYANLPALSTEAAPDASASESNHKYKADDVDDDDTSDESVDMDDDLGSSAMDSDEDDDDDDSDDADGSDGDDATSDEDDSEQASGLLGMLFGKAELKKLKTEPGLGEEEEDEAVPSSALLPAAEPVAALTNGHHGAHDDAAAHTNGYALEDENNNDDDDDDDVAMVDMPPIIEEVPEAAAEEVVPDSAEVPSVDAAAATTPAATPETDALTAGASPGQSQSPHTLDTKPSEPDTPMTGSGDVGENGASGENGDHGDHGDHADSSDLLVAPKETSASRSVSPAPTVATAATAATGATTTAATPKTEIPFLLRGTLRAYQHYGLDWLAGLYANRTNGILADEMGLGKTIQTIALLAHLACHHEVWGPHLVIVPTSVILNWEMEFKKWCPAFKILTYYGSQEERKRKRVGWTNDDIWNVCITSYQIVVQDQQVFKRRRWHYMILDEAHNIKNFKSQRWQSLLGFNTHARLLLTGTPLQNNLTELWSLLFFLMPPENGMGGFADLSEFHDWFHKPESQILESGREEMDEEARAIIAKLHKVLRPYLLRRLKADVEKQMPAKYEHVELCRLSKRQRELYDGFLARSDTRATLSSGNYLSIINCLMQLRKVCNHPDLFVDRPIMTSFRMQRSVPAAYETAHERLMQRWLLLGGGGGGRATDAAAYEHSRVNLQVLNLVPTAHELSLSAGVAARISQLATNRVLAELREAQRARLAQAFPEEQLDALCTVQSSLAHLEKGMRWRRFEELQHTAYLNALRRQRRAVYGKGLLDMLTLGTQARPFAARPRVPAQMMAWFENDSFLLHNLVQPLGRRSAGCETTISKFACVTPAVVTRDMNAVLLGRRGVEAFTEWDLRLSAPVKRLPFMERQPPRDPWHEARMRLTIQFPDRRLLQYDCGKLQALDRLLRRLQAGGHRALIFTQMTKVLDILEQFLNIHGHKYLRLDGATKIEQRQILTDRFNHDQRILCFILSTRSGGLGINLTGADTVIFYDQDWNPAMDKQCQDRCHRIGQTRDVHIYRLVSEHTIEANILRKASQKQMLDDVVIQEGEFTTDYFNKMSVKDVLTEAEQQPEEGETDGFRESDAVASAAMERVLGGVETAGDPRTAGRVLEQAEDREDVAAARLAEKEILQDDADFSEKPAGVAAAAAAAGTTATATASGVSSVQHGTPGGDDNLLEAGAGSGAGAGAEAAAGAATSTTPASSDKNAWGAPMRTIDDFMLEWMGAMLQGTALELPKDRKKSKRRRGKDTRKR